VSESCGRFLVARVLSLPLPHRCSENAHPRFQLATAHLREPWPFVAAQLVPALMELFGDVEHTGYQAVTMHRIHVGKLLNFLWGVERHRGAFFGIAEGGSDAFVSFTQGLVSHTAKYLGDGLKELPVIRASRQTMADAAAWAELSPEAQADLRKRLSDAENVVRSCFFCAAQTTPLLARLTTRPAICARLVEGVLLGQLAAMLVQCIELLAGPKAGELKVETHGDAAAAAQQLGFAPRALLRELLGAFLNLAREPRFVDAVAASAMWRPRNWQAIAARAERVRVLDEAGAAGGAGAGDAMARLRDAIARIDDACLRAAEEQDLFSDPPEHFVSRRRRAHSRARVCARKGALTCEVRKLAHNTAPPLTRRPAPPSLPSLSPAARPAAPYAHARPGAAQWPSLRPRLDHAAAAGGPARPLLARAH